MASLTMVETEVLRIVDTAVPTNVAREVLLLTVACAGSVLAVVKVISSTDGDEDSIEPVASDEAEVTVAVEVKGVPVKVEATSSEKVVKGVTERTVGSGTTTVGWSWP